MAAKLVTMVLRRSEIF